MSDIPIEAIERARDELRAYLLWDEIKLPGENKPSPYCRDGLLRILDFRAAEIAKTLPEKGETP